MEVVFRTRRLRRNYEESANAIQEWGPEVGKKYVTRINELYRVKDFHGAYSILAMRLHPLKGTKEGLLSIHLTGRWRLIVTKGDTEQSLVIEEISNHYDS